MIGHNQPSIDSVVEENLMRGIYLSQLNTITRAIRDPRLSARHLQVLGQIIERTNFKTGLAYPGRARLASDITYYINGDPKKYSEATIATTISDLVECGYIIAEKRAPEGKGRALAHYATLAPSVEDLQAQITVWCEQIKGRPKRDFPAGKVSEVDTRINLRTGPPDAPKSEKTPISRPEVDASINVDAGINVRTEVDTGIGADVDTGIGQEYYKEGTLILSLGSPFALEPDDAPASAGADKTRKKGSRLPDNWVLPLEWRRRSQLAHGLSDAQIDAQEKKFYRYWVAKSGKDATKIRWDLTWDNWIESAIERGLRPGGFSGGAAGIPIETAEQRRDRIAMGPEKYAIFQAEMARKGVTRA